MLLVGLEDSNLLLVEARGTVNDSPTLLGHVLTREKPRGFLGRCLDCFEHVQNERLEHFRVTHVPTFLQHLGHNLLQVRQSAVGLVYVVDNVRVTGIVLENDSNVRFGVEHGGNSGVE